MDKGRQRTEHTSAAQAIENSRHKRRKTRGTSDVPTEHMNAVSSFLWRCRVMRGHVVCGSHVLKGLRNQRDNKFQGMGAAGIQLPTAGKQQLCRITAASNIMAEPWTLHCANGKTSLLFLSIFSVKSVTRSCVTNAKPPGNR